jgi:hypothetical protein
MHATATPRTQRQSNVSSNPNALARYTDRAYQSREIVRRPGSQGSTLVIDRLAGTLADQRLLAHLSADEPAENAHVVCGLYLADQRRLRCRALTREDLHRPPEGESSTPAHLESAARQLADANGVSYVLAATANGRRPAQLRWHRCAPRGCAKPITLREVVGALQSCEPARSLSESAIRARGHD